PKSYFIIGSEMNTTYNNQTTFIYVVEGDEPPAGEVKEELEPAESSLENNANLTEPLKEIVLSFANVTLSDFDMMTWDPIAPGQLYRAIEAPAREAEYELVEEVNPKADDDWSPKVYTYTFSEPVSANGSYKFVIAAGLFWDNAYAESNGESGNINPELVYNFTIGGGTGVEAILAETGNVDVYDIAGRVIVRNADAAQLKDLASGMYIINGKKYVVK
ncbi:MAG: T9SS type A sorting domain-containing protein, partial [Muribaculaceae bacterium]|nr:T9SS type A sorting domain-containing protein [Muribaculaceae bacterium]